MICRCLTKVVIFDASGRGGICHYTFQLAKSLVEAGCDVTMMVPENYELKELTTNFKLRIVFKRSLVKRMFNKIILQQQVRSSTFAPTPSRPSIAGEQKWCRWVLQYLAYLRLRLILIRAIIPLLWSRPDLVHFQWLGDVEAGLYFMTLVKRFGLKVVYTVHDLLPHDMDTPENRKVFRKVYALADRLIVHADKLKQEMIEMFGIEPGKLSVIPHGSNALFFHPNISKQHAREYFSIPLGKKVILFFGLIKPYKGIEYLLQAFSEIKERVNDSMLFVVGRIADEDPKIYRRYSELLSQFSDKDSVKCVAEYISFDRVGYVFSAADVVVLPHIRASQSGVLLSAIAAGKPVVVTDTGGLSEVVEDGRTGFVVPPRDAEALSEAIINILQHPVLLEQMGNAAKKLADTDYAWKAISIKTIGVYNSLFIG